MKGFQKHVYSKGNVAAKFAIVGSLTAVVLAALYLASQVVELYESGIYGNSLRTFDKTLKTSQATLDEWWLELADLIPGNAFAEQTSDYDREIAEAKEIYNKAIIRAKAIYNQVKSDENADSETEAKAKETFTLALLDAKEDHDKAIAEIKAKYNDEKNIETKYQNISEARQAYLQAIADAKEAYEKAIADATDDNAVDEAKEAFNQAILDARKEYEMAKAVFGGDKK